MANAQNNDLTAILAKLDAMSDKHDEDIKSVKGSISNLLGRVQALEGKTESPAPSGNLIADTVKTVMADDKQRGEFLGELDLETLDAAEKAAAAEVDTRLWQESKVKYASRKARQYGPTLLVGAAAGVGGVYAYNRYTQAGENHSEVAEPADLKVAM
jgi:hypothetical protein